MSPSPQVNQPLPPPGLAELQRDFGYAISRPFLFEADDSGEFVLATPEYPEPIVAQINPDPDKGQDGATRLSTYNRLYWFRLLTIMQEEYPLLCATLGLLPFNKLVMAYLDAYPPYHTSVRYLSDRLQTYLRENKYPDQILQAATLEYHYIEAFDAAVFPPLSPTDLQTYGDRLLQEPLLFQPSFHLFQEDWNLVHWRKLVKTSSESDELEVSLEPDHQGWAIWCFDCQVTLVPIDPIQYTLLYLMTQGQCIEQAIEETCSCLDEEEQQAYLSENIGAWFSQWAAWGWFRAPNPA